MATHLLALPVASGLCRGVFKPAKHTCTSAISSVLRAHEFGGQFWL
jgi:hypothetical protein